MRWKILPAVLALTLLSAGLRAQETAAQVQPYDIDRNGVLMLVRSSLIALDHANKTGNYTVLRELGAPGFQRNNAAVLAEAFSAHRAEKLDLGGVLVIEPQLTLMPRLENGMLHMAGFFPSVPAQVHFDMLFAPVDRSWKLTGFVAGYFRGWSAGARQRGRAGAGASCRAAGSTASPGLPAAATAIIRLAYTLVGNWARV